MKRHTITIVLSILLAACGGGGSSGTEPAPVAAAPAAPPAPAVPAPSPAAPTPAVQTASMSTPYAAVGDSTMTTVVTDAAAAQLRGWLGDNSITIKNDSYPGTNSAQRLAGTDGSGLPWSFRLDRLGAKLVIDNDGINDNWRDPEDYRNTLRQLVQIAQTKGIRYMVVTPHPIMPTVDPNFRSWQRNDALAQVGREVAAETGALLCDMNRELPAYGIGAAHYYDGIHLTEGGQTWEGWILGRCIFQQYTARTQP